MFTLTFWKAAAERAVNTFAQGWLAAFIVGGTPTEFSDVPWWPVTQVALIATLISVIKSVIVNTASQGDGPGFTSAETLNK